MEATCFRVFRRVSENKIGMINITGRGVDAQRRTVTVRSFTVMMLRAQQKNEIEIVSLVLTF